LILIYYIFFHGDHGFIQYWKLSSEKERIQQEILELQAEQKELKTKIELLKNNTHYIEKIAREQYKMGRKGDKIYVVLDSTKN